MPEVAVIIGSETDLPKIKDAVKALNDFEVKSTIKILSAHRTPDEAIEFARGAERNGIEVIICGAGLSAHLPGIIAANTTLPVIGIPFSAKLGGLDSLLSIVDMPSGVPVATVGIDSSKNAALLAIQILSIKYPFLSEKIKKHRTIMREDILNKNKNINELMEKYEK